MKTKSFPVRSSWLKSLDPDNANFQPSFLGIESNKERFGSGEMVPNTCDERDVPHKERHCGLGTDRGSEPLNPDACIVCELSDERVSSCSGIDCLVRFHGDCLTPEFGGRANPFCPYCWFKVVALKSNACIVCQVSDMSVSRCSGVDCLVWFHPECLTPEFGGSEDLANPFCPFCWFKVVALKSKSWRDKAISAEKAASKYLDKDIVSDQGLQGEKADCSSKEDQVPFDKDSHQPEEDKGQLEVDKVIEVEASEDEERVATENVQDAEDDDDDYESGEVQTKFNTDVAPFLPIPESYPGKGHYQVQQNEKQRRHLEMNATDCEISSTKERIGEDVTELRKSNSATKSKTVRDFSLVNKDTRRRQLWTSEEKEMLRVGVEKFAAETKRNMPWRKILEMGKKVFHQTRTPDNLKDKWRNMLKEEDKGKLEVGTGMKGDKHP